jgi:hypothetical protein
MLATTTATFNRGSFFLITNLFIGFEKRRPRLVPPTIFVFISSSRRLPSGSLFYCYPVLHWQLRLGIRFFIFNLIVGPSLALLVKK